ncbi:MAG: T9SS type A sorting domain-containing protein [Bacteroidales bacterium]|nr:T9SS type A sorting domain-containing protein [Bacteroidales bacterium]
MKKLFTAALVILFTINNYAQITITDYSGLDLTNTTAFLPSDEDYHFVITNDGASATNFITEVTSYSIPKDADEMSICGGGTCVSLSLISSFPAQIGNPVYLDAGDTYGEEGSTTEFLYVHYYSGGITEQAVITIKIYEEGNTSNFTEFTLDTKSVGLDNISTNELFSVYPNPATNYFTLKSSNELKGTQIVFTNLLGKVVLTKSINKPEIIFSTNQFVSGIYFYSIIKNNKIIETKKLIVK